MSGTQNWSAMRPIVIGLIGIAVLFGGFGTWAATSNIAGAIIASGRIEVDRNRQVVQHDTGGTIAQIHVDEGDLVNAGDLLLKLDPAQFRSELTLIEGQLFELMARRGRLEAQRDGTPQITFPTELVEAGASNPDAQELMVGTSGREEAIAELRETRYRELSLIEQRRALLAQINRLDIRAPVSGIVYSMEVTTPRSVIRPADPLLFLIPQDRPLVIAAQVLPTNVDEITVGQEVNLQLSSLDQRNTPELKGQVVLISADALDDPATGQSYFGVEISLSLGEVERLPEGTQLLPGMPVDAFIKTGDRSPLTYLVKPLTDYFVKSWRES
jgi:multidrug efflux pump subunit AcrA (membrane-fusion protein)